MAAPAHIFVGPLRLGADSRRPGEKAEELTKAQDLVGIRVVGVGSPRSKLSRRALPRGRSPCQLSLILRQIAVLCLKSAGPRFGRRGGELAKVVRIGFSSLFTSMGGKSVALGRRLWR